MDDFLTSTNGWITNDMMIRIRNIFIDIRLENANVSLIFSAFLLAKSIALLLISTKVAFTPCTLAKVIPREYNHNPNPIRYHWGESLEHLIKLDSRSQSFF